MSINKAIIIGRLVKDLDLKYTQGGNAVTSFTLAVDRNFKGADGNKETDFINCQAWRKTAEIMEKYLHKGSLIGVEGRIQTRSYDDQQGNRKFVTEIVADNVTFLESKNDSQQNQNRAQNNGGTGYQNQNSNNYSQNNQNGNSGQYGGNNTQGGFSGYSEQDIEDSLPF